MLGQITFFRVFQGSLDADPQVARDEAANWFHDVFGRTLCRSSAAVSDHASRVPQELGHLTRQATTPSEVVQSYVSCESRLLKWSWGPREFGSLQRHVPTNVRIGKPPGPHLVT